MGVLRCYGVRHGPGPFPTEEAGFGAQIVEHNQENPWQGAVRYGPWDAVLGRYALEAVGGVDRLILTHLDLLPRLPDWRACVAYRGQDGVLQRRLPLPMDLEAQARLAEALTQVAPEWSEVRRTESEVLSEIVRQLERPIDGVSRGPTAMDLTLNV